MAMLVPLIPLVIQFGPPLVELVMKLYQTATADQETPEEKRAHYARIAAALEQSPSDVLFVSDIGAELDAAETAGMRTALCVRTPGSTPTPAAHPVIHTFDQIDRELMAPSS